MGKGLQKEVKNQGEKKGEVLVHTTKVLDPGHQGKMRIFAFQIKIKTKKNCEIKQPMPSVHPGTTPPLT